jgi:hypothetical protein
MRSTAIIRRAEDPARVLSGPESDLRNLRLR